MIVAGYAVMMLVGCAALGLIVLKADRDAWPFA